MVQEIRWRVQDSRKWRLSLKGPASMVQDTYEFEGSGYRGLDMRCSDEASAFFFQGSVLVVQDKYEFEGS